MSNPPAPQAGRPPATREEMMTALFAQMVIQQTNMALMLLGKVPHPETGETIQDLDAATMFIDQLEMLESKTRGNLNKQEEAILKQGLTALRMAYVELTGGPRSVPPAAMAAPSEPESSPTPVSEPKPAAPPAPTPTATTTVTNSEPESPKKFSKKY